MTYRLNSTQSVAVDPEYRWNKDMSRCPKGVKVQLLTKYGCAIYGQYTGKEDTYVKWAPLPTNGEEEDDE